jgi:acetolactate synthase I/II/III large subunit
MNGATSLVKTLTSAGVEVCFANPGTSEMHLVAALDQVGDMQCVLGLFEGVATGAADAYARMADRPAPLPPVEGRAPVAPEAISEAARALRSGEPVVLFMGGHALR